MYGMRFFVRNEILLIKQFVCNSVMHRMQIR